MSDPERCLEQAHEAERLASVVSYERDRARLLRQAAEWRDRAAALEAESSGDAASGGRRPQRSPLHRVMLALFGTRHGG